MTKHLLFPALLLLLFLANDTAVAQSDSLLYEEAGDLYDAHKYKKALTVIDKALKENDKNAKYFDLKGLILYAINEDIDELFDYLGKAVEAEPNSSYPLIERAIYYEQILQFQNAILDYNDAEKLASADSVLTLIYTNRGGLYNKIQKPNLGYDDLMKGYKIDSNSIGILNNLAMCLDDLGRREESTKILIRITEIDSLCVPAWVNLGFQASLKEEFESSLNYLNKANDIEPNQPLTLNNRGYAKFKLNDLEGALADINESIKLDPTNSYAYRNKALVYLHKEELEPACENLYLAKKYGFALYYGEEINNLIKDNCIK